MEETTRRNVLTKQPIPRGTESAAEVEDVRLI